MPSTKWITLLAAVALAPAAAAQNLLANPSFDDDIAGWQLAAAGTADSTWSADDALDQPTSGSIEITYVLPGTGGVLFGASQCVPVAGGAVYDLAGWARIPAGQPHAGEANVQVGWYSGAGCSGFLDFHRETVTNTGGDWSLLHATGVAAPATAHSARVDLYIWRASASGSFTARFDEVFLCPAGACAPAGTPEPPYASWIASAGLPGFSAQVRITTPNGTLQGQGETDCIAETICVRGALAGRPELFAKVIGPRPNGYLWAQVIRFTPSQVELWLRQDATGEVNYYRLDAVLTAGELSGLDDRTAFLP